MKNSDDTITLNIDYKEDIQNKMIKIFIKPALSNDVKLSKTIDASANLVINPKNNQGAYFYDNYVYSFSGLISKMCIAISVLSLIVFLASIINSKIIGIEMMAVLQIIFFSLMTISQMNPCFAALSSLWLVNSYNSIRNDYLRD